MVRGSKTSHEPPTLWSRKKQYTNKTTLTKAILLVKRVEFDNLPISSTICTSTIASSNQ